jgi:hypothetical protein
VWTYNGNGKAKLIDVDIVDDVAGQAEDDDGQQELETARNGDPERRLDDVIIRLRGSWVVDHDWVGLGIHRVGIAM